jgi:hypothetical protein
LASWYKLIDYLRFYVPLKNFSLIWRRHHCRWRAANFGLCSALRAFEQVGIFIMSHLLWHGTSVFSSLIRRTTPFSRQHTRGVEGDVNEGVLFVYSVCVKCVLWGYANQSSLIFRFQQSVCIRRHSIAVLWSDLLYNIFTCISYSL